MIILNKHKCVVFQARDPMKIPSMQSRTGYIICRKVKYIQLRKH